MFDKATSPSATQGKVAEEHGPAGRPPSRRVVVTALGTSQTLAWASSYYLPAILADPISAGLGVPRPWVFASFSASLLIAAFAGPAVGRIIDRYNGRGVLVVSNLVFAGGLAALAAAQSSCTAGVHFRAASTARASTRPARRDCAMM
jgi:MFS family permease